MSRPESDAVSVLDLAPPPADIRAEVLEGLRLPRKRLPCKLFYDERGSRLFEEITRLPEYYPTRTESAIMRAHVDEMSECLGERCLLVEFGSGSSEKTRYLLEARDDLFGYVPIDISGEHLVRTARSLAADYPTLKVMPVRADYTAGVRLPDEAAAAAHRVVYFPGSTIGNFDPGDMSQFLRCVADMVGARGGLLVGVDLKKDPNVLHAAYNDRQGVTARFNKNLLLHVNDAIGADFDPTLFDHYAFYDPREGRIEMHLVSAVAQEVQVAGETIAFAEGEAVHTENSYKYTVAEFGKAARGAGFVPRRVWMDDAQLFSVHYLEVT